MRVLVDANVFISYLLTPEPDRVPIKIMEAAFDARFALLVSEGTLIELERNIRKKSYLRQRISNVQLADLIDSLNVIASVLPLTTTPSGSDIRDPKDDYLIAHALRDQVDILVSGDRDLLALADEMPFRILTPIDFLAHLDEH